MKVAELQIGDWVTCENEKIQVTDIYQQGSQYYVNNDDTPVRDIEPIPLTEKILERNGFTHCLTAPCGYYHAPVYEMFDILFHISEDTYEDTWHTEVFTDHNDNNFVLYNLCYIHELQHCLRLCGLNELADNLKVED